MATDGTDWSYRDGKLDQTLALTPEATAYAEDLGRRFNQGQGSLWYDPLFGLYAHGIRDILHESGITPAEVARDLATCARHDPRTASVTVDVPDPTFNESGGMRWSITVKATMRKGGQVIVPLVVE